MTDVLPVVLKKLVGEIKENQVLVVSGETGCGKTTQVPQFILDDFILRGEASVCNILCTQPRRISAISVSPPRYYTVYIYCRLELFFT